MDDAAEAYREIDFSVSLSLAAIKGDNSLLASAIRGSYAIAAAWTIISALSAARKDYRKIVDLRGVREQEQKDVDGRDEEHVEAVSTLGAAFGLGLGLFSSWTVFAIFVACLSMLHYQLDSRLFV